MNKHLLILGIAVLLICVGLSGCEESESYSIIGQWDTGGGVIEFYEDGTLFIGNGTFQGDGTYTITESTVTLTYEIFGVKTSQVYKYEFQDADKVTIIEMSGNSIVWKRLK